MQVKKTKTGTNYTKKHECKFKLTKLKIKRQKLYFL